MPSFLTRRCPSPSSSETSKRTDNMNAKSSPSPSPFQLAWPELTRGTLVRRYKRFLADVILENGETVVAHCPNSGSMAECSLPGRPVFISRSDDPKRKLKYTWEVIEMPGSLVGVNTQVPNRLVAGAIQNGDVPELAGYDSLKREVKVGSRSRLDVGLTRNEGDRCFVEIKNCTLVRDGLAMFPDAVTTRGQKHLREMEGLLADGARCVMFYLIQRMDAERFRPADGIDPAYGEELRRVAEMGVEILAYDVHLDMVGIRLRRKVPFVL